MDYFFNQIDDIKLASGMKEATDLKQQFTEKVDYQGRSYSLYKVYARQLNGKDRLLTFLSSLVWTILSFGALLLSKDFRDQWQSVFTEKHVRVVYLPVEVETQEQETKILETEKHHPIPVSPLLDIKQEKKVEEPKIKQTVPVEAPPVVKQESPLKVKLSDLLADLPVTEGFNLSLLNLDNKRLLWTYAEKWYQRVDKDKSEWTIEELSTLLAARPQDVEGLCFRMQLFHGPDLPLHTAALDWFFKSLWETISNAQRATFFCSAKLIWGGHIRVSGQENRFPKGMKQPTWKIDELSMFLSVKKEALLKFLELKKVFLNEDGSYSSAAIDTAINNATGTEMNSYLENNRTQTHSLRFAVD